ncbi:ExbD/TolR family protein [Flavobacterium phragmitis]|uniref:Biopolymer transport protein ExbD/TolR n=1 Tax=Flavobacterium phragmitis TaxID=739143 RepID=A0A1I1XD72_9FLAO|nr:biopolymer transporter ExbD [Flavobacterium phragmitis]SFE05356.1 Biopolymer transport protein ExbD/TolR [Flavobacterium phragmitis]
MKNLPQKVRSKKLHSRVDLTAMVSVSFLLIIFFMLVGELSKPKGMDLSLPDKYPTCLGDYSFGCYNGNRLYTVLLGENNKIVTYAGSLYYPIQEPKETNYSKNGFRTDLNFVNKKILEYSAAIGRPNRGAIVFIKPSNKSNYGNLIDVLEELRLAKIDTYAVIDEFSPEETKLLASN